MAKLGADTALSFCVHLNTMLAPSLLSLRSRGQEGSGQGRSGPDRWPGSHLSLSTCREDKPGQGEEARAGTAGHSRCSANVCLQLRWSTLWGPSENVSEPMSPHCSDPNSASLAWPWYVGSGVWQGRGPAARACSPLCGANTSWPARGHRGLCPQGMGHWGRLAPWPPAHCPAPA